MYYLTSVQQVIEELRSRRKNRHVIQSMLDQNIESLFGIPNYSRFIREEIARSIHGQNAGIDGEKTYGFLARQIPGTCSEDIACNLLSRKLGIVPCSFAFTRDTFHSNSNDKLFRAKVPFISWSKKGRLVINHKCVLTGMTSNSYTNLNMVRMDKLQAGDMMLAEYHRTMQHSVFSAFSQPSIWGDISPVYGEILARVKAARKQPPFIWRSNGEHKDAQCTDYTEEDARGLIVRPSSKWYYYLYLSMFLDGTFVLLETYDNEAGGVPEARKLFETEMNKVFAATGFMPLVVKTTPLRPDMLYVNQHILDNPARAAETLSGLHYWSDDTSAMTRWFADQVIQFGRTA